MCATCCSPITASITGTTPACSWSGALGLDGALALELAPGDRRSAQRGEDRADHDVIHDLAIAEALQHQPPEQAPLLALLHHEADHGGEQVDHHEDAVIDRDLLDVGAVELGAVLEIVHQRDQDLPDE